MFCRILTFGYSCNIVKFGDGWNYNLRGWNASSPFWVLFFCCIVIWHCELVSREGSRAVEVNLIIRKMGVCTCRTVFFIFWNESNSMLSAKYWSVQLNLAVSDKSYNATSRWIKPISPYRINFGKCWTYTE